MSAGSCFTIETGLPGLIVNAQGGAADAQLGQFLPTDLFPSISHEGRFDLFEGEKDNLFLAGKNCFLAISARRAAISS